LRRLPAVESLGSVTVICTDKTGTLTHNHLTVHALHALDETAALRTMVLANDATETEGDPLDIALLAHARACGLDVGATRARAPRVSGRPFDSAWKFTRTTSSTKTGVESHFKGAPEAILARARLSPEEKARWEALAETAATEGRRVLALARRADEAEHDIEMLGLIELTDPPREEARGSVLTAQHAGIRVILLTGDHPATALNVARHVGIPSERVALGDEIEVATDAQLSALVRDVDVFARILPQHKLRLVEALQGQGETVAMVGDGVNDAPALKRADIGIAMGLRGSDVAREAAALVLLDDNFATIIDAIEEGRGIHAKTQTILRFMFSTSLGFVFLVLGGILGAYAFVLRTPVGAFLAPLTASQILWINFLADGPPAFALGTDHTEGLLDEPPPRPDAPLLDKAGVRFVLAGALTKAAAGLALLVALPLAGFTASVARTSVFIYEYLAQLAFASPSRAPRLAYARNRVLWISVSLCVVAEILLFAFPAGRAAFDLVVPSPLVLVIVLTATGITGLAAHALRRASATRPPIRARRNQHQPSRSSPANTRP
jgi:Ca2+-transporting ATPase